LERVSGTTGPEVPFNYGIPPVKDSRDITPYAELLKSISGITLDETTESRVSAMEEEDGFLYDLYAVEEGVPEDLNGVTALNWDDHGVFLQDDETWQKDDEEGEEDSNDEDNWQNEYGEDEESDENWHEEIVSGGEVF
jgi:hypothetical protein